MAEGSIIFFNQFDEDLADKLHNVSGDVWKLGLVDSTTTPLKTTSDPRWGAGGTTDFSANEVTPGGNYSAGGVNVSTTITDNLTRSGAVTTFTVDNVSIAQHASNPTNARWGILYNSTDTGKRCAIAVDLGAVKDLSSGPFTLTWSGTNVVATSTSTYGYMICTYCSRPMTVVIGGMFVTR